MPDFGLSRHIPFDEITAHFQDMFPGIVMDIYASNDTTPRPHSDLVVSIDQRVSEFPYDLSVSPRLIDRSIHEDWLCELARCLSVKCDCRVWYGRGFGDCHYPYHCTIWESGHAFLGDYGNSDLMGESDVVKILHPISELAGDEYRIDLAGAIHQTIKK